MGLRPPAQSIQETAGQTELDGSWSVLVRLGATFGVHISPLLSFAIAELAFIVDLLCWLRATPLVALTQPSIVCVWPILPLWVFCVVVFAWDPIPLLPIAAAVAYLDIVIVMRCNPLQDCIAVAQIGHIHPVCVRVNLVEI